MSVLTSKPTLYATDTLESKRVRAMLGEKGKPIEVVRVTDEIKEALDEINAEGVYPLLVDRGLVAYGHALEEFIHERWPGPQLLPLDPLQRAQARMLAELIRSWYGLDGFAKMKHLREVESAFEPTHRFFFGPQVSVVDIALIPLLHDFPFRPLSQHFAQYIERLQSLDAYREAA